LKKLVIGAELAPITSRLQRSATRKDELARERFPEDYDSWFYDIITRMIIHSESEMIAFGEQLAQSLAIPSTVELIGDIGVGKTTLVKGIAKGFGITDQVNSPSFMISKTYHSKKQSITLSHFDFYRLTNPGIMQEELNESIENPDTVTIVEWASAVKNVLPKNRIEVTITSNDDGTRTVKVKP
jgi:tRNA threonylcarbamoyladenosine biosynthesis protein TsaE